MKVPSDFGLITFARVLLSISLISMTCTTWSQTPEVDQIRAHAEAGEAEAENTMGLACKNGRGVPQDFAQALKWFQKAAEKGNPAAQRNLAMMYADGQGAKQDYGEAAKWLRKAADQNFTSAQNHLAMLC